MKIRLSPVIQTPDLVSPIPIALLSGTFEEKIRKASALGYDGVELMPLNPKESDVHWLASLLHQHKLEVSAIASGALAFTQGLTLLNSDPQKSKLAASRLHDFIDFAAALGAPILTIGSVRGRLAWEGAQAKDRLISMLIYLCDYAHNNSVQLAIEPLNRYENDFILNARQGLEFIQELNHPGLGLLLDTYHMNIEESSWVRPIERALQAGKLLHVHLGDNNRLPPGNGMIDFAQIIESLCSGGYQGYLSAELLALPDGDSAAQQTVEFIRTIQERISCD